MRETRRPTVMVAANNEDTRFMLRFWLEAEGYGVVEAADGEEAVALTCGRCPDLILISERMPRLGGVEATRRIREQVAQSMCPIVCMSTHPTLEARDCALGGGCDSFIAEPPDFGDLGSLIGSLLHASPPRRPPEGG